MPWLCFRSRIRCHRCGVGARLGWSLDPGLPGGGYMEAVMSQQEGEDRVPRSTFMLIFRGGAVSRHDLSPTELQAHVEKWYRWSEELAGQGRRNTGTALGGPGATVRGRDLVTDGPYA